MDPFELSLTRDELLVFLAIIGSKTMNGLEEDPLADLDDREIAERLNSGEQSLINRGLLVLDDENSATLDDTLVALVGSSVVPEATFLLNCLNPDGSNEPHYFNATAELLVEYQSSRPGIYVFDYLPTADALRNRFQALVAPLASVAGGEIEPAESDLRLTGDGLAQIISDCQEEKAEMAKQHLLAADWPATAAERFTHDCSTYPTWLGLVAWNLRTGDSAEGGGPVMIVQGESACWLIKNDGTDSDHVRVRSTTGPQGIDVLVALLDPLWKTLSTA